MKKLLLLVLFLGLNLLTTAQSGWNSSNYYQSRGEVWTQTTYASGWDYYAQCYVNIKYCRTVTWHRTWREGYTYSWSYYNGRYRWVSNWYSGYSWYYTWGNWYRC